MGTGSLSPPPNGNPYLQESLLTGHRLAVTLYEMQSYKLVLWAARSGLVIAVMVVLTALAYTVYSLNRLLNIYDREMTYRAISIRWQMKHGGPLRRETDPPSLKS